MNLENINVQELNRKELKNVDGGIVLLLALAGLCLLAGAISKALENKEQ